MVEEGEDQHAAGTCVTCLFRLRFGFRRALFVHLYLTNEPLVAFVRKLGIKGNADVARMMRVFLDVDVEGKHVIELDTFFDFFNIESSEYNKRAFRILTTFRGKNDQSGDGSSYETERRSLTFDHFFVSMYDYGTLVQDALVRFVFDTMACGKGFCSRQDVRDLVSLLHSDPGRVRQTTSSLVAIMDPHNRDMISFETFRKEKSRLGSMLFPAFNLQKTLRAKILGVSYWNRATKNRRKAGLIESDLHKEYMMLKDEHTRKLRGSVADDAEMVGESEQNGGSVEGDGIDYSTEEVGVEEAGMSPADTPRKLGSTLDRNSESLTAKVRLTEGQGHRTRRRADSSNNNSGGGEAAPVAEAAQTCESISDKMLNGDREGDDIRRRSTVSKGSDNARRRRSSQTAASEQVSVEAPYRSDDGERNPRRDSLSRVPGARAKRRSSLTAASAQVAPGRHGSMFEDMQVFSPTSESSEGGRRSSVKTSRTTRRKSRKVSATSASYDAE